jgi:membrane protease YdiL (CAAX protease family)
VDRSIVIGWIGALLLMGLLTARARGDRRPWAGRALALLLLYLVTFWLMTAIGPPASTFAALAAGAGVLLAITPLIGLGLIERREIGLAPPLPGSSIPAVTAILIALAFNLAVMKLRGPAPVALSGAVLVPLIFAPLIEEFVFRGVLLALVDRARPPRWNVAGARIGAGGVLLTLAFVSVHGLRPGVLLGIAPAAFLYLWLRARTGSLAWPLAGHVAWNLSVLAVHA